MGRGRESVRRCGWSDETRHQQGGLLVEAIWRVLEDPIASGIYSTAPCSLPTGNILRIYIKIWTHALCTAGAIISNKIYNTAAVQDERWGHETRAARTILD